MHSRRISDVNEVFCCRLARKQHLDAIEFLPIYLHFLIRTYNDDSQTQWNLDLRISVKSIQQSEPLKDLVGLELASLLVHGGNKKKQFKHLTCSAYDVFFNTPIQGPLKPIYVVPWATLLTICEKKRLQKKCLKSNFEGLLTMSHCAGSD